MDSRSYERLEENMLKHKTTLLHRLIEVQDTNPVERSCDVRDFAHRVADMLERIDKTLAVLKRYVKSSEQDLPLNGWGC